MADEATPTEEDSSDPVHDSDPSNAIADAEKENSEADTFRSPESRLSIAELNRGVIGELVVHFPQRDARFIVDGEAALRLLALYSGTGDASMNDRANPFRSSAYSMWIGIDLDEALAVTWTPSVTAAHDRAVIDPVPPVAA